jgi:metallo-beta-lactamase family protein
MRVGFYGGVEGVTGSCFLLEADNKKVLIDCGLFQGLEEPKESLGFDAYIPTYEELLEL